MYPGCHAACRDDAQALGAVQLHQARAGVGQRAAGKNIAGLQKMGDVPILAGRLPLAKPAEAEEGDSQFLALPGNRRLGCRFGHGLGLATPPAGRSDMMRSSKAYTDDESGLPGQPTRAALNLSDLLPARQYATPEHTALPGDDPRQLRSRRVALISAHTSTAVSRSAPVSLGGAVAWPPPRSPPAPASARSASIPGSRPSQPQGSLPAHRPR